MWKSEDSGKTPATPRGPRLWTFGEQLELLDTIAALNTSSTFNPQSCPHCGGPNCRCDICRAECRFCTHCGSDLEMDRVGGDAGESAAPDASDAAPDGTGQP